MKRLVKQRIRVDDKVYCGVILSTWYDWVGKVWRILVVFLDAAPPAAHPWSHIDGAPSFAPALFAGCDAGWYDADEVADAN